MVRLVVERRAEHCLVLRLANGSGRIRPRRGRSHRRVRQSRHGCYRRSTGSRTCGSASQTGVALPSVAAIFTPCGPRSGRRPAVGEGGSRLAGRKAPAAPPRRRTVGAGAEGEPDQQEIAGARPDVGAVSRVAAQPAICTGGGLGVAGSARGRHAASATRPSRARPVRLGSHGAALECIFHGRQARPRAARPAPAPLATISTRSALLSWPISCKERRRAAPAFRSRHGSSRFPPARRARL